MKILMPALHYYPVIGGLETWTKNIAEEIALRHGSLRGPESAPQGQSKAGQAEIFVVTGRVKGQPQEEVKNGVKIFRTSLVSLGDLSHSPLLYILTALLFIFLKSLFLARNQKIGLIHCQGFLGSCIGYCLSKIMGIPYVVTVQRLESKSLFKGLVYRNAKVCIAASSAIKKYFEEIGCKNIEVVPNGIDLKRFENLERKPHDGFVVMSVARLERVKGIEFLIRAFDFLMSDFPGKSDIKLFVIGDGSKRKNLEKLTQELGLGERVKFLGEIPNEKIQEYLAQADCFVLPSLKEGFGIVILEAMAAGLPVIGTKVGGMLDLIEDGKIGLLVEPADAEALAKAIYEIHSGRKFIKPDLEKYNWQNIADKVYKIYEDSLS